MFQSRIWILGLIALLFFGFQMLAGCQKSDWKSLDRYQQAIKKSERELFVFAQTMRNLPSSNKLNAIRFHLKRYVDPSLRRYIRRLSLIRPETKELAELHSVRLNAYRAWSHALSVFLEKAVDSPGHLQASMKLIEQARFFSKEEKRSEVLLKVYASWMKQQ